MRAKTSSLMENIRNHTLDRDSAALWFLGQAGYIVRDQEITVAIDPYLSDSAGRGRPGLSRKVPVPIPPEDLCVDICIVTHDHLDHLDPETVVACRNKDGAVFVAPRLACEKLVALGVEKDRIRRVDAGEAAVIGSLFIKGVYAVPTGADVIDTAGYLLRFANGRSVYHSSDTGFSRLLLDCAPLAEVFLLCINGKWGNLSAEEAAEVAACRRPRYAVPNHYDMMELNSADPEAFKRLVDAKGAGVEVKILKATEHFIWKEG